MPDEREIKTPPESKKLISRRAFLTASLLVGGTGLGMAIGFRAVQANKEKSLVGKPIPQEWLASQIPLGEIDLVSNPDYWVGESGEKLSQELSMVLYREYENIHPTMRRVIKEMEGEASDLGEWQGEKIHKALDELLTHLADRGKDIVVAKTYGFDGLSQDLDDRYYEMASYTQMLCRIMAYKNRVGLEKFCREAYQSSNGETIGNFANTPLTEAIDRKKIFSVWNYDWRAFSKGNTVLSPVGLASILAIGGFELTYKPYVFAGDPFLSPEGIKPPINPANEWYTKRPGRVQILDFDEEVAARIRMELSYVGIERGINRVVLMPSNHLEALTITGPKISTTTIYFPQNEKLDIEKYLAQEREILHVVIHEGYHSLSSRRTYLPIVDRIRVRDLESQIFTKADPLVDLRKVFNPNGDDHGYILDNEHSVQRYYLDSVLNLYGDMPTGAYEMLDEFRVVISMMTDEDIFRTFWLLETDKDLDGLFNRLERDIASYTGITKLIAQTLTTNKDAILKRKFFNLAKKYDSYYFQEVVMPLVFSHLLLYKPSELSGSALSENLDSDRGLVKNYIETLRKRFRTFIKSGPEEEYLADIFAEAMLTRTYGKHNVDFVNDARPKFEKILAILRKNNLAVNPQRLIS